MQRRNPYVSRFSVIQPEPPDHYWSKCKSDWSIIPPNAQKLTNLIQNPSFEGIPTGSLDGWCSLNGNLGLTGPGFYGEGQMAAVVSPSFPAGPMDLTYCSNCGCTPASPFPPIQFSPGDTVHACVSVQGALGDTIRVRFFNDGGIFSIRDNGTLTLGLGVPQRICHSFKLKESLPPGVIDIGLIIESDGHGPTATGTKQMIVDGVYVGAHPTSLYFDGDFPNGYWTGVPHASTSELFPNQVGYGETFNLADLGLDIFGDEGWGEPIITNITAPLSRLPGSFWQGDHIEPRVVTFSAVINAPNSRQQLHAKRRSLLDSLHGKMARICDEKTILRYQMLDDCCNPLSSELLLQAVYTNGAQGIRRNPREERITLQFTAYDDPFFYTPGFGTALIAAQEDTDPVNADPYDPTNPPLSVAVNYPGSEPTLPIFRIPATLNPVIITELYNDTTGGAITFGSNVTSISDMGITIPIGYELIVLPAQGQAFIRASPGSSALPLSPSIPPRGPGVSVFVRWPESNTAFWRLVPGENLIRVLEASQPPGFAAQVFISWQEMHSSIDYVEFVSDEGFCRRRGTTIQYFSTSPYM